MEWFHPLTIEVIDMANIWHDLSDKDKPKARSFLLCYVDGQEYITVYYIGKKKFFGAESEEILNTEDIKSWAYMNDVLKCIGVPEVPEV